MFQACAIHYSRVLKLTIFVNGKNMSKTLDVGEDVKAELRQIRDRIVQILDVLGESAPSFQSSAVPVTEDRPSVNGASEGQGQDVNQASAAFEHLKVNGMEFDPLTPKADSGSQASTPAPPPSTGGPPSQPSTPAPAPVQPPQPQQPHAPPASTASVPVVSSYQSPVPPVSASSSSYPQAGMQYPQAQQHPGYPPQRPMGPPRPQGQPMGYSAYPMHSAPASTPMMQPPHANPPIQAQAGQWNYPAHHQPPTSNPYAKAPGQTYTHPDSGTMYR